MAVNRPSRFGFLSVLCVMTIVSAIVAGKEEYSESLRQENAVSESKCYNLGADNTSVGPYNAETGEVVYDRSETITTIRSPVGVSNTRHEKAFQVQISGRKVAFHVNVDKDYTYDVQLGFAELVNCKENGSDMKIVVNKRSLQNENVFQKAGCANARFITFGNIRPNELANIHVKISGESPISIATLCVYRRTMIASAVRQTCGQAGCITRQGRLGVQVVSASLLSLGCKYSNFATRALLLPSGSVVQYAKLQWAVFPPARQSRMKDTIRLNGVIVKSESLRKYTAELYFASATVTNLVRRRGVGKYTIGRLNPAWKNLGCQNTPYAGWFLTVIYSNPLLPVKRVNICASGTNFYSSTWTDSRMVVKCTLPKSQQKSSRAILLAFAGETGYPDLLTVNSYPVARNAFVGRIVRSLDVVSVYFTKYVHPSRPSTIFKIDPVGGYLDYIFVVSQIVIQVLS